MLDLQYCSMTHTLQTNSTKVLPQCNAAADKFYRKSGDVLRANCNASLDGLKGPFSGATERQEARVAGASLSTVCR